MSATDLHYVQHMPLGLGNSGGVNLVNNAANPCKTSARFFGGILLLFGTMSLLLAGYLAFAQYWIRRHSTEVDATVLSGELRQRSTASTRTTSSTGTSNSSYYFHCVVTYRAEGRDWQSQLDSPASPHMLDEKVWAARLSPGQVIGIRYKTADPARIRLADNPAALTAAGAARTTCYLLIPGIVLLGLSRADNRTRDR